MTIIPNIASLQGIGTGNSLISQGNGLIQPNALGFMNMLLNPLAAGQIPAESMMLEGNNLQALVEKIAAALHLDPADPKGLLQILEQLKAQQTATATINIDDIKPTLMSDLGASSAVTAQEMPEGEGADMMAAMLNQMDVGAETGAAMMDTDLLQKLREVFARIVPAAAKPTVEQLAQFTKEAEALLKTQGVTAQKDIQQYLDTLSIALDVKLSATAVATPVQTAIVEGPIKSFQPSGLQAAQDLKKAADKQRDAAVREMPATATQAAAKKETAAADTGKKVPTNMAMINALAAAESETDGLSQGASGEKGNSVLLASLKHASDMNLQSMSNYLTAGRALPGETAQMIALQMQRNMAQKVDTFTLQLDPADLGRLDIRIKFDKDGAMKAHMSAERPETLSMLQRDQHHLNRVLQEAGIDIEENALSFDLRQQRDFEGYGDDGTGRTGSNERGDFHKAANGNAVQAHIAVEAAGYVSRNRVDIRV